MDCSLTERLCFLYVFPGWDKPNVIKILHCFVLPSGLVHECNSAIVVCCQCLYFLDVFIHFNLYLYLKDWLKNNVHGYHDKLDKD